MKTKFIKVNAFERLPEKEGVYLVTNMFNGSFSIAFFNEKFGFYESGSPTIKPSYWLEEVPDNEEENIKQAIAFGYNTGFYNGRNNENYSRPDNGEDYAKFIISLK